MAQRNFANSRFYSGHVMPVLLDMNFVVTPTNGLGITSLKGPYVQNVFMHTSTTPAAGNVNPATPNIAITNPNPANGTIVVQLQDSYNSLYSYDFSIISPNSGSDVKIDNSAMTAGVAYTITTLGNATAAKWRAIGVPAGVTAAVGVSFIAASDGGAGNTLTSRVQTTATAGSAIMGVELVGNPNLSAFPNISAQGFGSQFIFQCRGNNTFTGNALASHDHNLIIKGGQAASTTNDVAAYAGPILGKEQASDATILGANSAASGGVVGASAGTPAGSVSSAIATPATGSIISLKLLLSNSSITINGE